MLRQELLRELGLVSLDERNVTEEIVRLFAADCAWRAYEHEYRMWRHIPDVIPDAIEATRWFAEGLVSSDRLERSHLWARDAVMGMLPLWGMSYQERVALELAGWSAVYASHADAAYGALRAADAMRRRRQMYSNEDERMWQRERFVHLVGAKTHGAQPDNDGLGMEV